MADAWERIDIGFWTTLSFDTCDVCEALIYKMRQEIKHLWLLTYNSLDESERVRLSEKMALIRARSDLVVNKGAVMFMYFAMQNYRGMDYEET